MKKRNTAIGKPLAALLLCAALLPAGCGQGADGTSSAAPSAAASESGSAVSRGSVTSEAGELSFTPSDDPDVIAEKVQEALAIIDAYVDGGKEGELQLGSELAWYLMTYGGEEGMEAIGQVTEAAPIPNRFELLAEEWAGSDAEAYHMTPVEAPAAPFLLVPDSLPTFGSPFESKINGEAAYQLVRVLATVETASCPYCGDAAWALVDLGPKETSTDTICWIPTCCLSPYEDWARNVLTYPLWAKPGVTAQTSSGETADASTLGAARGVLGGEPGTIRLTWAEGYACEIPRDDVLSPDPDTVNALTGGVPGWEELFPG